MTGVFRPQPGEPSVARHAVLHCLGCGKHLDAAGTGDQAVVAEPGDGDFSICFGCGEVSVYVVGPLGVALRKATTGELAAFSRDPRNVAMVRRMQRVWLERPR